MKKLIMLLGAAAFLHMGVGENEQMANTVEDNSEELQSDVQPEVTETTEQVVEVEPEVEPVESSAENVPV